MAEVNANSLPAKTDLGTNDSAIVVDQTTNAGALVDLDVLADKVLDRLTSKTFANQVGGSSAATLLAQLSTLNSNTAPHYEQLSNGIYLRCFGKICILEFFNSDLAQVTFPSIPTGYRPPRNTSMAVSLITASTKRYIANCSVRSDGSVAITYFDTGSTSATSITADNNPGGWVNGQVWWLVS